MEPSKNLLQGSEQEVQGAISAFEEILEVMPNDRVALETLYEGYMMLGNHEKAGDYLARLATTVVEEQDLDEASRLLPALHQNVGIHPSVNQALTLIEGLLNPGGKDAPPAPAEEAHGSTAKPSPSTTPPAINIPTRTSVTTSLSTTDVTADLSMAWNVHQAGELSEEEYSTVVQDLTELASRHLDVPVSVLHVLGDRGSSSLSKILQFIVKDTNTPYLQLSRFDLDPSHINRQLPDDFLKHYGALVFDQIENDPMVAILNPYYQALKDEVERILGQTCHFYLTNAEEYDYAIGKLLQRAGEDAARKTENDAIEEANRSRAGLRLKGRR